MSQIQEILYFATEQDKNPPSEGLERRMKPFFDKGFIEIR